MFPIADMALKNAQLVYDAIEHLWTTNKDPRGSEFMVSCRG